MFSNALTTQLAITCSKLTIETLEQGVNFEYISQVIADWVEPCIKTLLDKLHFPKQKLYINTRKGNVNCFSIFYFCYEFENRFVLTVNKTLPQCNVKVIFQSKNYLSNSLKFKDSISVYLRSHLIYKFQCNNCNTRFFYKQSQTEIGKKWSKC